MNFKHKITLLLILTLGLFLRTYRLNEYPALNADEAAIGYNAYSLIETGKDEHGNSWPIHFQSFNDYKPGLYFYIVLPFVKYIGLNEWAVRLPSALLGVATIYVIYLLCEHLFSKKQRFSVFSFQFSVGEIAAFFLAISPWHIHFSRGGWEVNVATFFILFGLYLLLKGVKNVVTLFLSAIIFALSIYTYHAARVIVPLLILGFVLIYWNQVKVKIINVLLAGLLGLVALTPLIKEFTNPDISSRATGIGLFADKGPIERINEQRGEHLDITSSTSTLLHNKAVNYGLVFLKNWTEHYHGEFLFLSGGEVQRNKVPETGQMYLFDMLLIVIGLALIIGQIRPSEENNSTRQGWFLILWWLVIAPVPAALTFQSPHALRSQNMVIPLTVISAFGLLQLLNWMRENVKMKYLLVIGHWSLVIFVTWQFARYLHIYWTHMAKEYPFSSQYGVKELVEYVNENEGKYKKIIVTDSYDQPYILFLFYNKYSPEMFQKDHKLSERDEYGFSTVGSFGKYEFRKIDYNKETEGKENRLIIGNDDEIPNDVIITENIYGENGHLYFQAISKL